MAKKKLIKKAKKKTVRKKRAVKKKAKKKASRGQPEPEPEPEPAVAADDDGGGDEQHDGDTGGDGGDDLAGTEWCFVCEGDHASPPCDPPEGAAEAEEDEEAPAAPAKPLSKFDMAGSSQRGRSRISALASEMGREWGTHTAMPMDIAPVVNIMRMPIGILEFDYRTGGGLVIGRNNRIDGRKDTLKSTMCLRALRAAQKTCRHCKWRLVTDPQTGGVRCRCPETRYWVAREEDYALLPPEAAIALYHGKLPEGTKMTKIKGYGKVPALVCDPPPHLEGKKGYKRRPIPFKETFRCEPMRCVFVDTEGTVDRKWAEANGVDPSLVLLVGGKWAEQCLEAAERTMLSREFDFIVIDSTSMLETREHLEDRKVGERGTPAGKQKIMGDFIKRVIAAQAEEGLAGRYRPTLLTTSHLTQKGIGYGKHQYMGPTDGNVYDHGVAMDIRMKADRFIFDKDKQKAIRGEFTFTITKNHCGGMGSTRTSGQIKFWLIDTPDHPVGDSNDFTTVMDYARAFGDGFIVKRGSNLILQSDMIEGGRKVFRTVTRCREYLRENDTVYDDLRHRVLEKLIEDRAHLVVSEAEEPEGVSA